MAASEATDLIKAFKDLLPPSDSVWSFILNIVDATKEGINATLPHLKIAGDQVTHLSKTFIDSLPPRETVYSFLSEKTRETISHGSDLATATLPYLNIAASEVMRLSKGIKDSLPPLVTIQSFISNKTRETISHGSDLASATLPYLKMAGDEVMHLSKTFKDSLPPLETVQSFISNKTRETISHGSDLVSYTGEKLKESPLAMSIKDYTVEKMYQHSYSLLFGLIAFVILWKFCSCGSPKKMMKAPGRKGKMMVRSDFEGGAKSYFKQLREKSGGNNNKRD